MTIQIEDFRAVKDIRFYGKQGVLRISKRFVNALGWNRFQNLFLVRTNDNKLIITDEKNFVKIKLNENSRVFKAKLSGSTGPNDFFNHRVMISKELFDLMDLHKSGAVTLRMDKDKLIVEKTIENGNSC